PRAPWLANTVIANSPRRPASASGRRAGSSVSAFTTVTPCAARARLRGSSTARTRARTGAPRRSSARTTAPPCCPVAPRIPNSSSRIAFPFVQCRSIGEQHGVNAGDQPVADVRDVNAANHGRRTRRPELPLQVPEVLGDTDRAGRGEDEPGRVGEDALCLRIQG